MDNNKVLRSDGVPYLCPIRGMDCTKKCAFYGTASIENDCALTIIAESLARIADQMEGGIEVFPS